jgi:hypothetical protein
MKGEGWRSRTSVFFRRLCVRPQSGDVSPHVPRLQFSQLRVGRPGLHVPRLCEGRMTSGAAPHRSQTVAEGYIIAALRGEADGEDDMGIPLDLTPWLDR